jgi:hypothetical protein
MKDTTKFLYESELWRRIESHPAYDLGKREKEALKRFLENHEMEFKNINTLIHLAIATGSEFRILEEHLPLLDTYIMNDICAPVLHETQKCFQDEYLHIETKTVAGDIETPGIIQSIREHEESKNIILALIGNAVIFSNDMVEQYIADAMYPGDRFLITVEIPHDKMCDSYMIDPVFELLSREGKHANSENTTCSYNNESHCLEMSVQNKVLLASYKASKKQIEDRLSNVNLKSVQVTVYEDIHMVAGLFQK